MEKIDMMSVWQGIEYKLVKQQEAHMKATGMLDYDIAEKIEAVRDKMQSYEMSRYAQQTTSDKDFMSVNLAKYGITL
jgi:hypothetical protein